MEPLKTQQTVLSKLCICPIDENESRREKKIRILLNCTLHIIMASLMISSAFFIWKSVNLEERLCALFQIGGCVIVLYPFVIAILLRREIIFVFENLTGLYDECKKQSL